MSEAFTLDDKHFTNAGIDVSTDTSNANERQSVQTQNTDTQSGTDSTQASSSTQNTIQGGAGKDSISSQPNSGSQQEQKKEGQSASDPELKPGDLKLQDGTVVKAGAERRHFENARMFRAENIDLKNQINTTNQKYQTLEQRHNELKETISHIGLQDPAQVTSAVRLYKDLVSDPVKTMTNLLAELKAKGHTFEGIGGAVDTLAIQQTLADRLPQQQQGSTPEQQMRQVQEEAHRETQQFLAQYPDAMMHEQALASIIEAETQAGRDVDLRNIYFKLRQAVINQGMDWNSPLGPQIEARKQQQQQQTQQPPMQGGRQVNVAHTENIDPFKSGNSSNDKDSIIIAAMKDAGLTYAR